MPARKAPSLLTNVPAVRTPLGETLTLPPQLALCRCGASSMKPFCDGTHARLSGFTDDKDPNRVPDRRDAYLGQQVPIFDNRGICPHPRPGPHPGAPRFPPAPEPFPAPTPAPIAQPAPPAPP